MTKKQLIAELGKTIRENRSLREQRNQWASAAGKAERIHVDWLHEMEPFYQAMVVMAGQLGIKVRNPIELTERLKKIDTEFNKLLKRGAVDGAELAALRSQFKDAEERAERAEFQARTADLFCKDAEARLANERERSRTAEFRMGLLPSLAAHDKVVHQVHVLSRIITNILNAVWKPAIAVCPSCGKITPIPEDAVSQNSGYRLCGDCLGQIPDPWKEHERPKIGEGTKP